MKAKPRSKSNARAKVKAPARKPDMARQSAIPGVRMDALQTHTDPRGSLTELYRDDELPRGLKPAMSYISITKPGQARGPHEHRRQTDLFCFLGPGNFQIWLWDNRRQSRTFGRCETHVFGASYPCRLIIPPGVVHGYKNISRHDAACFNAPDRLYAGRKKSHPVDEIRYENLPGSPFRME